MTQGLPPIPKKKMGLRRSLVGRLLLPLLFCGFLALPVWCKTRHYVYNITEASYTRLCETKKILTVNGQYPGPTIYARRGDTVVVQVFNHGNLNVTIHWHGVKQPRNPWSDGPEYITQCPIQPSANFTYNVALSDEEGTLWWHAHSDWSRATVHGAIIIYPPQGKKAYPFDRPHHEVPIIIGEWWKSDIMAVVKEMLDTGSMTVKRGARYLLRMINAAMNDEVFFSIAEHPLTVLGSDGAYIKPYTTDYIAISPGQTMDLLLEANKSPGALYYMAVKAYSSNTLVGYDNTTGTALLQYKTLGARNASKKYFPVLPPFDNTDAVANFTNGLKSLADEAHPIDVPKHVDKRLFIVLSINMSPCSIDLCGGPNNTILSASMNNISFVHPEIDVLGAYYKSIGGVYKTNFPKRPPLYFNFTAESPSSTLLRAENDTRVIVLDYNTTVEIVFQGTSLVAALTHPMHVHGYSFYLVGHGAGNYDQKRSPSDYNLVDPPLLNTFGVPRQGWAAIRFRTDNPGVWFMHCHFDRHVSWGMETVFIVRNGKTPEASMLPPPSYRPPC
ncbi:hypothetical protein Taro_042156 [Colocasia esculenta]|uniref:laccase n=1 Tax=Colocasia esculenta TaxID=4460 RepID=A0A843WS02_COLES|nr:hypothetical protein [Colocasia esculenta]